MASATLSTEVADVLRLGFSSQELFVGDYLILSRLVSAEPLSGDQRICSVENIDEEDR
jgi:hypothetical protein